MIINVQEIFKNELKRLGLNKKDVADQLGITYPALAAKIKNVDNFKFSELRKLADLNINLKLDIYYDTRFRSEDV
tara:strand:+ start:18840 stop:19064 length:225 start_codon:yes stop_codon:yes gene_type:complete